MGRPKSEETDDVVEFFRRQKDPQRQGCSRFKIGDGLERGGGIVASHTSRRHHVALAATVRSETSAGISVAAFLRDRWQGDDNRGSQCEKLFAPRAS
jgi:hypothetical protein